MSATTIKLYELAGAEDERRFSPFCWRIRFALLHKGLPFEALPWRFTEKETIAFSGQKKVPVIVDGKRVIHDSWIIAEYLEDAYAARPSLFGGPSGKALSRFATDWVETVLHPGIFRLVAIDVYAHLHDKDKDYFRKTREARFGMTLDALCADREERIASFRDSLAPLLCTLDYQPFLAGQEPAWADYVAFSAFQWARCVSSFPLLVTEDAVFSWRERMLDAFDGEAHKAVGYAC